MIAGSVFAANDSLGSEAIGKLKTLFADKVNVLNLEAEGFCQGDACRITDETRLGIRPGRGFGLQRRAPRLRRHRLREVQGLKTHERQPDPPSSSRATIWSSSPATSRNASVTPWLWTRSASTSGAARCWCCWTARARASPPCCAASTGCNRSPPAASEVGGTHVESASAKQLRGLRRNVGFVFQHFNLVGRLSCLENVLIGGLGQLRLPATAR